MENLTIAQTNDILRKLMIPSRKFRIVLSEGVASAENQLEIVNAVRNFKDWNEDNNPYGENDGAMFVLDGERYYFKFDYYDSNLEYGLEPTDPNCIRVLTIMLMSEY